MNELKIIDKIFQDAIDNFNSNEEFLIRNDVSERCICSKFACYLDNTIKETIYSSYKVDVEYNRNSKFGNIKTLNLNDKTKKVIVDLVIHKRGCDDNLICCEMKKSNDRRGFENDIERLIKMLKTYNYKAAYLLIVLMCKTKPLLFKYSISNRCDKSFKDINIEVKNIIKQTKKTYEKS